MAGLSNWKLLAEALHLGDLGMMSCVVVEQQQYKAAFQVTRQPYLGMHCLAKSGTPLEKVG